MHTGTKRSSANGSAPRRIPPISDISRPIERPIRDPIAAAVYWNNQHVIDGVVNGTATLTYAFSGVIAWFDRNVIDGVVNGAGTTMELFGRGLRTIQTGKVQWYAVGLFAGVILLTVFIIRP